MLTSIQSNQFEPIRPSELDLRRLKHKMTATEGAQMSAEEWDEAELGYRRFLTLKQLYPSASLVPSQLVDKVWHAHILDTRAYRDDCQALFGYFLDHYPYFGIYGQDDHANLQQAFAITQELYQSHFGDDAPCAKEQAARCADHACHAPSQCACRVPGACK